MTIYLILLLSLIILTCASRRVRYADWIGLLLILLVACLRSEYVGIDLQSYVMCFTGELTTKSEYGFQLYMSIIRMFTDSSQLFIAITSILSIVPIFLFLKKVSDNTMLSLLLYFLLGQIGLLFTFSGLRQALAIAITVWVYYFYDQRRFVYAFGLLAIAFFFHNSAIFVLPVLLLTIYKIEKKIAIWLLLGTAIFGFFGGIGLDLFSRAINHFPFFSAIPGLERYISKYADYESDLNRNIFGLIPLIVPYTLIAIYSQYKGLDNIYTRIYFIGVCFSNILVSHSIIFRYTMPFTLMVLVVFPKLVYLSPRKILDEAMQWGYLAFMCIFFVYLHFKMGANYDGIHNTVVPYRFFFE